MWPLTSDRWREDFSPLFNQPGSTLSLLHVNQWPHPPSCSWIQPGYQWEGWCHLLKSWIMHYPPPVSPARCGRCTTDGGHPPRCRAVQGGALACHQTSRAAHHQHQQVRLFLQQVRDRTPHPQVWHPPQSTQIKPNTWGTNHEDVQCIICYSCQNSYFSSCVLLLFFLSSVFS